MPILIQILLLMIGLGTVLSGILMAHKQRVDLISDLYRPERSEADNRRFSRGFGTGLIIAGAGLVLGVVLGARRGWSPWTYVVMAGLVIAGILRAYVAYRHDQEAGKRSR